MQGSEKASGKAMYAPVSQKDEESNVHIPLEEDEGGGDPKQFTASKGLSSSEAEALLARWGKNELEEKNKPKVII